MFLDNLPVSYVIYTEGDKVKTIIGIEMAQQHWNKVPDADTHFGILPIFVGSHHSFDELMDVVPKDHIEEVVNNLLKPLGDYVEDPSEENADELIKKYNEINNG